MKAEITDAFPDLKEFQCRMVTFVHIGFYLAWLISVILSVTASVSIPFFTEVSVLSFGLELVYIVNHC